MMAAVGIGHLPTRHSGVHPAVDPIPPPTGMAVLLILTPAQCLTLAVVAAVLKLGVPADITSDSASLRSVPAATAAAAVRHRLRRLPMAYRRAIIRLSAIREGSAPIPAPRARQWPTTGGYNTGYNPPPYPGSGRTPGNIATYPGAPPAGPTDTGAPAPTGPSQGLGTPPPSAPAAPSTPSTPPTPSAPSLPPVSPSGNGSSALGGLSNPLHPQLPGPLMNNFQPISDNPSQQYQASQGNQAFGYNPGEWAKLVAQGIGRPQQQTGAVGNGNSQNNTWAALLRSALGL